MSAMLDGMLTKKGSFWTYRNFHLARMLAIREPWWLPPDGFHSTEKRVVGSTHIFVYNIIIWMTAAIHHIDFSLISAPLFHRKLIVPPFAVEALHTNYASSSEQREKRDEWNIENGYFQADTWE